MEKLLEIAVILNAHAEDIKEELEDFDVLLSLEDLDNLLWIQRILRKNPELLEILVKKQVLPELDKISKAVKAVDNIKEHYPDLMSDYYLKQRLRKLEDNFQQLKNNLETE